MLKNLGNLIIVVFVLLLVYDANLFCQIPDQKRLLDSLEFANQIDSLNIKFSDNKTFIEEYKIVVLIALSYFPELKNQRIEFRNARIKTSSNSRPTVFSVLFRTKQKRKYIIRINNRIQDSVIIFSTVPFNAKVGLIAHELSHIVDYNNRNIFQIFQRFFAYLHKSGRENYEKEIDMLTISHGLGLQLFDWADFVIHKSNATVRYKEFKEEIYLEPGEIKSKLLNYN